MFRNNNLAHMMSAYGQIYSNTINAALGNRPCPHKTRCENDAWCRDAALYDEDYDWLNAHWRLATGWEI
jgi:hypothetical protein